MKPIAFSGISLSLVLAAATFPAVAQSQAPSNSVNSSGTSLGDYARQVRKEPGASSKPKVFDNDNLPRDNKLSVVGKPAETADASSKPKQDDSAAAPASGETKAAGENKPAGAAATKPVEDQAAKDQARKQWADKLSGQKDQVDLLQRELDVLQREYQLRAAQMYADAGNRLRNSADWDQKDTQYKEQIADKQKAIDDAKQKLDDMQEDARKAGMPPSVHEQ